MGNNPVNYADPDGDIYAIPSFSFGSGGFSLGLEIGIGIPGVASAGIGGSYNFSNGSGNLYAQGTFSGTYAGYGLQQGAYAGVGFNSGAFNFGAGYSQSGGFSANIGVGGGIGSGQSGIGLSYSQHGGLGVSGSASTVVTGDDFARWAQNRRIKKMTRFDSDADMYAYQDPPWLERMLKERMMEKAGVTQEEYNAAMYTGTPEQGKLLLAVGLTLIPGPLDDLAVLGFAAKFGGNGAKLLRNGMSYKQVSKILKKNGWEFIRNGKGSHRIWKSPSGRNIPIPDHGSKSISRGIINQLNKS